MMREIKIGDHIKLQEHYDFFRLATSPALTNTPQINKNGLFEVKHANKNSYILSTLSHPRTIIKTLREGRHEDIPPSWYEFDVLENFKISDSDPYILPTPHAHDPKINTIVMSNVGTPYNRDALSLKIFREKSHEIGHKIGVFAAKAFRDFGTVHVDLHTGNILERADGKIGIVDLASMSPKASLEDMLAVLIWNSAKAAISCGKTFHTLTGETIDPSRAATLSLSKLFSMQGLHTDYQLQQVELFEKKAARHKQAVMKKTTLG